MVTTSPFGTPALVTTSPLGSPVLGMQHAERWLEVDVCKRSIQYKSFLAPPEGGFPTWQESLQASTNNGNIEKMVFIPLNHPGRRTVYSAYVSRSFFLYFHQAAYRAFVLNMCTPKAAQVFINITGHGECGGAQTHFSVMMEKMLQMITVIKLIKKLMMLETIMVTMMKMLLMMMMLMIMMA